MQWLYGATHCYKEPFWRRHLFLNISAGGDTRFVVAARGAPRALEWGEVSLGAASY
jgi:hypothetical protein